MAHSVEASATISRSHSASVDVAKTISASAVVDVRRTETTGTLAIGENGTYDVSPYASVDVNVPIPSNYGLITWNGSIITVS